MDSASKTTTSVTPAPAASGPENFIKRELHGATFLTLEHVAHMVLVVLVPVLIVSGILSALSLWGGIAPYGLATFTSLLFSGTGLTGLYNFEVTHALMILAALIVLVPALIVLDRRTRAEWHKRPAYAGRLAYKVPVYTALAILGALKVAAVITMLYVILESLAFIGVSGSAIGSMYLDGFLPAFIAFIVFVGTSWYVFKLAKGQDNGKTFTSAVTLSGAALALALLITTMVVAHSNQVSPSETSYPMSNSAPSTGSNKDTYNTLYRNYLDQLSQ